MARAVVTGIGCLTPIGNGVEAFSQGLRSGAAGVRSLHQFDPTPYKCKVAAGVPDFRPQDFLPLREARSSPRVVQFAVAASRMACQHAGLHRFPDATRVGVVLGTSVGPSAYNFEQSAIFVEKGLRRVAPTFPAQAHYGVIASECAIQLGARGPVMCVSSACTSSADAIGVARAMIETGMADVILAGGAEAPLAPMVFAALDRLSLMSRGYNDRPESASRPFAADRDGFVLGEGAAVLVLESEAHALARGASPLAVVAGYGSTCDAMSHFAQAEGGEDAARAIALALETASLSASDLDYVNAHGSATPQNDSFETGVLKKALGDVAEGVAVSSTKSMVGHLLGAGPAVELAATILGMNGGFVPPTINLNSIDPLCDLDYVPNLARKAEVEAALSMSFGFGSRNAALVVRRW